MLEAVILPLDADEATRTRCKNAGVEVILALPRALWGIENAVRARMKACKAMGDTHFYCGNLGALALCKGLVCPRTADFRSMYSIRNACAF